MSTIVLGREGWQLTSSGAVAAGAIFIMVAMGVVCLVVLWNEWRSR